jgi:hypothetical protein
VLVFLFVVEFIWENRSRERDNSKARRRMRAQGKGIQRRRRRKWGWEWGKWGPEYGKQEGKGKQPGDKHRHRLAAPEKTHTD